MTASLLLPLFLACGSDPAAPAAAPSSPAGGDDAVMAELEQSMNAQGARVPWARAGQAASSPASSQGLSPRDQADELFNIAMRAYETGDSATAATTLPLALSAYGQLADLDLDGLFHVAVLQLSSGMPLEARATADQILAASPTHLLALGVGGRAAQAAGDAAALSSYHQRYLDAYDAESAQTRRYGHHQVLLPIYLEEARQQRSD